MSAEAVLVRNELAALVGERLKPPPVLSVSEWADTYRVLPDSSAEPGRWRTERTPYLRDIMDAFSDDDVETVVFMAAAQIGKSECLLNVLGYFIDQDPSPILFVQEGDRAAAEFSKERIAPMIRLCKRLRGKVATAKSRDSGNTIESKDFPGGHLGITGAGTPGKLARRPRRVVLFDEVDKYPASAGVEGDPIDLGVKRTTTFWNKKIGIVSTPTIKGHSRIETAYEDSDQRRYEVPCPHCGAYQALKWSGVEWEKGSDGGHLPETAQYRCTACEELIPESAKPGMLAAGKWVAEYPDRPSCGFRLSALYSPWVSWSDIAAEFLESKAYPERLKAFINSRLAETYEERGEAPQWEILYRRRESYPLGTCPEGVMFLTAGADVQQDRVEVAVWGWGIDKESWLVDHRVFPGKTLDPDTWEPVTAMLHETFPKEAGGDLPIAMLAIDTGYDVGSVVEWNHRVGDQRIMLIKGGNWQNNWGSVIGTNPSRSDVTIDGKSVGYRLWIVGGALIKQETYGFLQQPEPLEEDEPFPPGYVHIPHVDRETVQSLVSEDLVTKTDRKGFTKRVWEKKRARNEQLDMRVYARAAAERMGLSRLPQFRRDRPTGATPAEKKKRTEGERDGKWLDRRGGRGRGGGWLR